MTLLEAAPRRAASPPDARTRIATVRYFLEASRANSTDVFVPEKFPPKRDPIEQVFDMYFGLENPNSPEYLRSQLLARAVELGVSREEPDALSKINVAADLAEFAHFGQKRKATGDPFVVHPYRTALLNIELADILGVKVDSKMIVDPLLHDTVEDNKNITQETIRSVFWKFGRSYANTVAADAEALSNMNGDIKLETPDYYEKVKRTNDPETLIRRFIVKNADRLDNLFDPARTIKGDNAIEKRTKTINKTIAMFIPEFLGADHLPEQFKTPDIINITDQLTEITRTGVAISNATLDQKREFRPSTWQDSLESLAA